MKTMRRILCLLLSLACIASMTLTFAYANEASRENLLRYTGVSSISAGLTIDNAGCANCSGSAMTYSGYSVNLSMKLQRDGTTIKTWSTSGSTFVPLSKSYYVTSGHNYQVVTSVDVYNSKGAYVATYSCTSNVKSY